MTAAYGQPFIAPPSPSQYPRVHDIISKNFRPKSVAYHLLLYGMLCNFLTNGSFAMPRSDNVYRANEWPAEYNRRNVVHAQDFLERGGLIKIKKGYRFREDNAKGVSTVVTSTPALEEMIGNVQLRPDADFSANQLITINEVVGGTLKKGKLWILILFISRIQKAFI